MPNMYINAMTALWNNSGTFYSAIRMNVTNAGSAALSKLLHLQVANIDKFTVDKDGNVISTGNITASGALTMGGALLPAVNNTMALGSAAKTWSDLWLGNGAIIDFGPAPDVTLTHSTNILTVSSGDFRVTTAGLHATSVVTKDGTQTLFNKTLNGGTITGNLQFSTLDNYLVIGPVTQNSMGGIARPNNLGYTVIYGGKDTGTGAYMQLFGDGYAVANARDIILGTEGVYRYFYDYSAATHYWRNNTNVNPMSLNAAGDLTITGQLNVDSIIQSSDTTMILASKAGGTIYLRGNGAASATEQVYVNSNGTMVINPSAGPALLCNAPTAATSYTMQAYGGSGEAALLGYTADHNYYGMCGRYVAGVAAYSFYGIGTALNSTAWTVSDARAKHDITDCDCCEAYGKVRAIGVKAYRKEGSVLRSDVAADEIGWLAQDIEKVIPEAVFDHPIPDFDTNSRELMGGDTMKATNDRTMLATLWAAVQHQAEIIEGLEAKIDALEAKGN